MSRAAARFREADVARAIKAARKAGLDVSMVEIDRDGRIRINCGHASAPAAQPEDRARDAFDEWERSHESASPRH